MARTAARVGRGQKDVDGSMNERIELQFDEEGLLVLYSGEDLYRLIGLLEMAKDAVVEEARSELA
jgi:hypothetical protein